MSRWKAAGIHLLVSLFVATAAIAAVILIMYPPPYTASAGAGKLLTTLIAVDVILGPLITLIIFKHDKPSLKFDLTVIAALQIGALVYGLSIVAQARPVFLAHVSDRFALVMANSLADDAFDQAVAPFDRKPWTGPMVVGTEKPSDANAHYQVLINAIAGGADLDGFPQYYVDYQSQKDKVLAGGKPLIELRNWNKEADAIVNAWLADGNRDVADYVYYPLKTRGRFDTLILGKDAAVVDILPIDPW